MDYACVDWPSWIQAVGAAITAVVTVVLGRYAKRSVDTADNALKAAIEALTESRKSTVASQRSADAAQQSASVSQKQFEREWTPLVEILGIKQAGNALANVDVLNLGRQDAILRKALVRRANTAQTESPLDTVAPSGKTTLVQLGPALNVFCTTRLHGTPQVQATDVELSIVFHAAGNEPMTTQPKRYKIQYTSLGITNCEEIR